MHSFSRKVYFNLIFIGALVTVQSGGAQVLQFQKKDKEFVINNEKKTRHEFTVPFVVNEGSVRIEKISTSCGCTGVKVDTAELKKGDFSQISGSIDEFPEGTAKTITLTIKGTKNIGGLEEAFDEKVEIVFAKHLELELSPKVVIITKPYNAIKDMAITISAKKPYELSSLVLGEGEDAKKFLDRFTFQIVEIDAKSNYNIAITKKLNAIGLNLNEHFVVPLIATNAAGVAKELSIHILVR